jgi:hypothetical protein
MLYRVILTKNSEYKKTLHRCKTETTSFVNFNKLKMDNQVFFEKKFVNNNGIIPVEYKIYVVKDYDENDKARLVRNKLGKLVYEKPIYDIWTVLHDSSYMVEETFSVWGYNNRKDRKTIRDIITLLVKGMDDSKKTKQVVVVHNKLLIHAEDQFDMVICKCKKDAQRLHHSLMNAAQSNKINNLLFMGTANKKMCGDYYEIIQKHTGWNYTKIWRTTTRP